MNLLPGVFRRTRAEDAARTEARDQSISFQDWLTLFNWNNVSYLPGMTPSLAGPTEEIAANFAGYANQGYKGNGVVAACMDVRMLLFSEARFQFRQLRNGRPGDLFGTAELGILENPWPNGTTGDLLSRMIQDVDLAGNFYGWRSGNQIRRLRPDWVSIVLGSSAKASDVDTSAAGANISDQIDAEIVGYAYYPGGRRKGQRPVALGVNEVAHFVYKPDPEASYRGMSWLTPIVREIIADTGMTDHKRKFLENGASPSMVVTLDVKTTDELDAWRAKFRERNEGVDNAYKTLFLGAGATPLPVGANFQQMDFKITQGAGETRIAAAAGVPPVIVGLSEGLQAATYSNYALAMRRFTDLTMRPTWRGAAASLAQIVNVPSGSMLWYDDRDVPALAEDGKSLVEIQQGQATVIHTLISAGYNPDSVIPAVLSNDFSKLEHTGLYSVQLQPAGAVTEGKGSVVGGVVVPAGGGQPAAPAAPPAAPAAPPAASNGTPSRSEIERLLTPLLKEGRPHG